MNKEISDQLKIASDKMKHFYYVTFLAGEHFNNLYFSVDHYLKSLKKEKPISPYKYGLVALYWIYLFQMSRHLFEGRYFSQVNPRDIVFFQTAAEFYKYGKVFPSLTFFKLLFVEDEKYRSDDVIVTLDGKYLVGVETQEEETFLQDLAEVESLNMEELYVTIPAENLKRNFFIFFDSKRNPILDKIRLCWFPTDFKQLIDILQEYKERLERCSFQKVVEFQMKYIQF